MLSASSTVSSFVNDVGNSSISSGNCKSPPMSFYELFKDSHSSKSSGSDNMNGRHSIVFLN